MKKRKIVIWGLGAVAGVGVVIILLLALSAGRTKQQYRAFEQKIDGAEERVTRLAAQMNEQLRMGADRPTSATRELVPPPARAGAPATTQTLFARKVGSIQHDWRNLVRSANHRDFRVYLPSLLEQGIGGGTIVLAASDFPDEGSHGALRGGAELRGRIRQDSGVFLKNNARQSSRLTVTADALSSGPLAAKLSQVLDRTGKLLLNDAAAPDPVKDAATLYNYNYDYSLLGAVAVLRAGLRGSSAEAGRMLERLVRDQLQLRLQRFPGSGDLWASQRTILLLAEAGKLDDGRLARVETLLKRARLDDKQLADLRAAYVLRMDRELEDADDREYETGMRTGRNRALLFLETQTERVAMAALLAAARPLMMGWVSGDEAAYDRAVRHPMSISFWMAGRFPVEMAAFSRDPAANDAVDLTRLVVAAARWRLARGHWPERIEELIPQYLEPGFVNGPESFYAIDRIEPPAGSGKQNGNGEAVSSRPIFYHARRLPLTLMRMQSLGPGAGPFRFTNTVRIEAMTNPIWGRVGLRRQVGMAQMMTSDQRVEGIVVRAVWPNPEPLATGWLKTIKTEPSSPPGSSTSSTSSTLRKAAGQ